MKKLRVRWVGCQQKILSLQLISIGAICSGVFCVHFFLGGGWFCWFFGSNLITKMFLAIGMSAGIGDCMF